MTFQCQPLNYEHITDFLDTGHGNDLGTWLSKHAKRFQDLNRCQVWVLTEDNQTDAQGFFTLSSHTISSSILTKKQRGGISENNLQPAQLLGKFAVDKKLQGKGVSIYLMHEVFKTYINVSEITGTRFLVLNVIHEKVAMFYESMGFLRIPGSPSQASPETVTTMIMPTVAIQNALKN